MIQGCQKCPGNVIRTTTLHSERALPCRGKHLKQVDAGHQSVIPYPKPAYARRGQHDGIKTTCFQLADSSVDVPTQRFDLKVRAAIQQLRTSAQTTTADSSILRQFVNRSRHAGNEHITHVFSLQNRRDHQLTLFHQWLCHGHIFQAMNRAINLAAQQCQFYLFREHSLPTKLVQRTVGDYIAGCTDRDQFHAQRRMPIGQVIRDNARLRHRQRTTPRAQSKYLARHLHVVAQLGDRKAVPHSLQICPVAAVRSYPHSWQ